MFALMYKASFVVPIIGELNFDQPYKQQFERALIMSHYNILGSYQYTLFSGNNLSVKSNQILVLLLLFCAISVIFTLYIFMTHDASLWRSVYHGELLKTGWLTANLIVILVYFVNKCIQFILKTC